MFLFKHLCFLLPDIKGLNARRYRWLFQHVCFSLILDIFSTLSIQKSFPNVYIMFQCKHNYVVLMILQVNVLSGTSAASIV